MPVKYVESLMGDHANAYHELVRFHSFARSCGNASERMLADHVACVLAYLESSAEALKKDENAG